MDLLKGILGGTQAQAPGQSQRMGLGAIFEPEIGLPMAAALLGNQGNMQNVGNAFGAMAPAVAQKKERNRTYDWLQKNAPEYAQLIDGGAPPSLALELFAKNRFGGEKQNTPANIQAYNLAVEQGYKGTMYDWETKGTREQDPTFGRERDLRKDYDLDPNTKNYKMVRDNYERIRQGAQMGTGAGDIAVVFGYMKMLDPTSVV